MDEQASERANEQRMQMELTYVHMCTYVHILYCIRQVQEQICM